MKHELLLVAVIASFVQVPSTALYSQPSPAPAAVKADQQTNRTIEHIVPLNSDSALHEVIQTSTDADGKTVSRTNRYTVLATGMYMKAKDGTYVPASTEIESDPSGGAIAKKAHHNIRFSANITDPKGVVHFTSEGKTFVTRPLCISYWDSATGKSVLLSEFRSTIGTLARGDSKIVWKNCSTDIKCNLVIDNQLAGMDQCLEILEQPPAPSEFGLNNASTRLEMITEFLDTPAATKKTISNRGINDDGFIGFSTLTIPPGKAFKIGDSRSTTHVTKQWTKLDGRNCLIEQIPYSVVERYLHGLPIHASANTLGKTKRLASSKRGLPKPLAQNDHKADKIQFAKNNSSEKGMVLDYSIVYADLFNTNPFTAVSGQTYLITNIAWFPKVTLEGGAVIKYTDGAVLRVLDASNIVVNSSSYNPVTLTAWNDDSVGEIIPGSDGSPSTTSAIGISTCSSAGHPVGLKGLNFRYLDWGLEGWVGDYTFDDTQAINCASLIHVIYGTIRVRNALLHNLDCGFNLEVSSALYLQNVTIHNASSVSGFLDTCADGYGDSSTWAANGWDFKANNCLFVNIGYYIPDPIDMSCSLPTNLDSAIIGTSVILSDDTGIFDTVGAGAHYLPTNSIYHGAGDTNIDATLLASLARKTTFSPIVLTNKETNNVTLLPRVARDASANVDLGYHYDPLDYIAYTYSITNAILSISNGAAIGYYCAPGIWLQDGADIVSQGTPLSLNRFAFYQSVQEQPTIIGSSDPMPIDAYRYHGVGSPGIFRFTGFHRVAANSTRYDFYLNSTNWVFNTLAIQDCQFSGGGSCHFGPTASGTVVGITNTLFEGESVVPAGGSALVFRFKNNLVLGGDFDSPSSGTNWIVRDCILDSTAVELDNVTHDHNAYINTPADDFPTNATDFVLTNFVYQVSPLGNYYQPTNSVLINAGSEYASNANFFQYTTTTNQIKEGASVLDVGLHYVALDSNGEPNDLDGDGTPDYFADANGDGSVDSGETPWQRQWIVAWTDNSHGQCNVPSSATNAMDIDGGHYHVIVLRSNGTVVAWGDNTYGQTDVPSGLNNVVKIVADYEHNAALKSDGTVVTWGQSSGTAPSLADATDIAVGWRHCLALRSNGTISLWGDASDPASSGAPTVTNAIAVAADYQHNVVLLANGTVIGWGYPDNGSIGQSVTNTPPGLGNVIAIAAGRAHTLALKSDGTVVAWGAGCAECGDLFNHGQSVVPSGLSNVVAIAAGGDASMALKSDGSVVVWGDANPIGGLDGVSAMGVGNTNCYAIRNGRLTPLITLQPQPTCARVGDNASFSATGVGIAEVAYQWQKNGSPITGATASTLSLSNVQSADDGSYAVVVSNTAGSTTSVSVELLGKPPVLTSWTPQQTFHLVPTNTTLSLLAVATNKCSQPITYIWKLNGQEISVTTSNLVRFVGAFDVGTYTVMASNAFGTTTTLSWSVDLLRDSTPVWCGSTATNTWYWMWDVHDVFAVAAGKNFGLAVRENGSVVSYGTNEFGQTSIPANLTNTIMVAAGDCHGLALNADGTIGAWGHNDLGQTNVPSAATNVIVVSAGGDQSLALRNDGTVLQWGQTFASIPGNLTNIIAIASGTNFHVALHSDGTVSAWGNNSYGQTNVPSNATNVVAVAAGGAHALALRRDATIVAWGSDSSGQTNVPVTLTNAISIAAGYSHSVAIRDDGSLVFWGDSTMGQTNIPSWLAPVAIIAAGGNQTVTCKFSALRRCDVSRELLLIYNTNSIDSSNICSYYLEHRPMVSNAMILGIGCTTNETFLPDEYTNVFATQVQGWLNSNPTKRPQYVILFYDMPSRISTNNAPDYYPPTGSDGSVQHKLHTDLSAGWHPLVTAINMNTTNDCKAYIDKLEYFGTNYSPGKLFISPSSSGYVNTNFLFDNIDKDGYYANHDMMANAVQQLARLGFGSTYIEGSENAGSPGPHLTNGVNIAGYTSWGFHSTLGDGYATNGVINWSGNAGWWIIRTCESVNGVRSPDGEGRFVTWFAANAFGGTNYSNAPIGAISQTDEPYVSGLGDPTYYFGFWALNKNFAFCAWNAARTVHFQATGDPFVTR